VFFPRSSVGDLPTSAAGEGVYLVDDQGRRLLDVCSGPFLANLGPGNERILQAMLAQGRRLTVPTGGHGWWLGRPVRKGLDATGLACPAAGDWPGLARCIAR